MDIHKIRNRAISVGSEYATHGLKRLMLCLSLACCVTFHAKTEELVEGKHPVTLEDVLSIEAIGDGVFSTDGRWLAYNLVPPYNTLSDYSYALYATVLSGHQLWIKEVNTDGPARLQPGLDLTATNFLFGFSPDDRHIIALEHKLGRFRLVACVVGVDDCEVFDEMPDILDKYVSSAPWNERLEWTSEATFVLPTRSHLLPGSEMRSRGVTGKFLWTQWNKAWRGKEVTASEVVSTRKDMSEDWASGRLVEFNIETGKSRILRSGRYAAPRVSPDGRFIAVAQMALRQQLGGDGALTREEAHPVFDRRYAPRLVDSRNGSASELTGPFSVDPNSFEWSTSGHELIVYGWNKDELPKDGRFYKFSIENLNGIALPTDGLQLANSRFDDTLPLAVGPARALILENGIAVYAKAKAAKRYDWILVDSSGKTRNLTRNLKSVSGVPLYADAQSIYVIAQDGIFRVDQKGRTFAILESNGAKLTPLGFRTNSAHSASYAFRMRSMLHRVQMTPQQSLALDGPSSGDDERIAFADFRGISSTHTMLDVNVPGASIIAASSKTQASLFTVKSGAATRLMFARSGNAPVELAMINTHLNSVAHPKIKRLTYQLNDPEGLEAAMTIDGCVLTPPDYIEGKKYPLMVEVYPVGLPGTCRTLADEALPGNSIADLWVSRGFIYIHPAIPLNFARTTEGPISGMDEIVESTVDVLIDQGIVDPERVALFGYSQGGISALTVAAQTSKFKAIISMNGWADFLSHYFGPRGFLRVFHEGEDGGDNRWRYECLLDGVEHRCPFGFGVSALDDPVSYALNSPVVQARNMNTPLLLIHSDLDYFDMSQYDEMFGALERAGKEVRYVRYWGEGHGPSSPANIRDLWHRFDQFLNDTHVIECPANSCH